jgi:hypothetical protein
VPRVERVPGRRKVLLQRPDRRPDRAPEQPARARAPRGDAAGDEEVPGARVASRLTVLWLIGLAATVATLVALRYVEVDIRVEQTVATLLGVLLAIGLAVRSGGRALPAAAVALLVGAGAVATQWSALLAGAAVATGVLAACLAILGTTPARSPWRAILEVLIAQAVATLGALGVAGFRVGLDPDRFAYTVLALSMAAAVALVYRLGGGVHGLGRSGVLLVAAALVLLVVGLAYTAALTHWGSPELRLDVDSAKGWMRDHLGAVPHPIEVLLGIPALTWGVTMRARRRQGWWVCAFGTTATATATARLIEDDVTTLNAVLGAAYSIVLGLVLGYVVIRVVRLVRGKPGRRAARAEGISLRPEPPRLQPLD